LIITRKSSILILTLVLSSFSINNLYSSDNSSIKYRKNNNHSQSFKINESLLQPIDQIILPGVLIEKTLYQDREVKHSTFNLLFYSRKFIISLFPFLLLVLLYRLKKNRNSTLVEKQNKEGAKEKFRIEKLDDAWRIDLTIWAKIIYFYQVDLLCLFSNLNIYKVKREDHILLEHSIEDRPVELSEEEKLLYRMEKIQEVIVSFINQRSSNKLSKIIQLLEQISYLYSLNPIEIQTKKDLLSLADEIEGFLGGIGSSNSLLNNHSLPIEDSLLNSLLNNILLPSQDLVTNNKIKFGYTLLQEILLDIKICAEASREKDRKNINALSLFPFDSWTLSKLIKEGCSSKDKNLLRELSMNLVYNHEEQVAYFCFKQTKLLSRLYETEDLMRALEIDRFIPFLIENSIPALLKIDRRNIKVTLRLL